MTRLLHIAFKDIKIWLRDPAALGVMLGMPVILILILGSAFGGLGGGDGGIQARVAIVNLDTGARSAISGDLAVGDEIVAAFQDNEDLADLFETEIRDDADDVRTQVERGDLVGALIIPADLSAAIAEGRPVELEVLRDPGSDLSSGILEGVVRSLANDLSRISVVAQTAGSVAVDVGVSQQNVGAITGMAVSAATTEGAVMPVSIAAAQAERDGEEITPLGYYSLSMTSMFLLFGSMFGAFAFIIERREQTMARIFATPTARASFVGGKMLGVFGLGLLQFAVLYAYTSGVMKVNWGQSIAATWMIAAGELAAATGLAVFIASIAKTERGAGGIGPLVIQIMALLGGAFFQISILPEWLQPIRYVSIIGWALEGFQKVQIQGAGPAGVLPETGALLAFAVVFFGIGVWRLRGAR